MPDNGISRRGRDRFFDRSLRLEARRGIRGYDGRRQIHLHRWRFSPLSTVQVPLQIVLMALCSCTSVDVVNILKKKRQDLTGLRVTAHATQAETSSPCLHSHQAYLRSSRRTPEPQSRRRCGLPLKKQVLLSLQNAREICSYRLRNRLPRRRARSHERKLAPPPLRHGFRSSCCSSRLP